ncbi:MAG: hypothetical protein ACXACU_11590 [Candidatus Hodarchaeales archaeon]|jgi:hypothetical protein
MKGSEKMAIYVGTFIFVIVGYIVSLIASGFMTDIFSGVLSGIVIFPKDWGIGVISLDSLTSTPRLTWMVSAIGWLLVCIFVNYGSTRWLEEGEKIGILSFFFVILWLISSLAMIVGYIVWSLIQGYSEVITLDPAIPGNLVDQYFEGLFWALSPSIAALLGVRK